MTEELTHYVAGFAFSSDEERVLLIKKKRPEWQKGKLNAIGGHIEKGETPVSAMVREFHEETGVRSEGVTWKKFCELHHYTRNGLVHFFYTHLQQGEGITTTDEEVLGVAINPLPPDVMPNLHWLIPMALRDQETTYIVMENG